MAKWAKCPECNKEFVKLGNQKYCQPACRRKQEIIRKYGSYGSLQNMNQRIPKCKDCEFHKHNSALVESNGSIKTTRLKDYHYCTVNRNSYPIINSAELKTSPKWCIKRVAN